MKKGDKIQVRLKAKHSYGTRRNPIQTKIIDSCTYHRGELDIFTFACIPLMKYKNSLVAVLQPFKAYILSSASMYKNYTSDAIITTKNLQYDF